VNYSNYLHKLKLSLGWPGSSSQRKAEIEPDGKKAPQSPLGLNEPLNIRGKETCKNGKCKIRHGRSGSDILRNHMKRYPHNVGPVMLSPPPPTLVVTTQMT
jgi:hypothetical protein